MNYESFHHREETNVERAMDVSDMSANGEVYPFCYRNLLTQVEFCIRHLVDRGVDMPTVPQANIKGNGDEIGACIVLVYSIGRKRCAKITMSSEVAGETLRLCLSSMAGEGVFAMTEEQKKMINAFAARALFDFHTEESAQKAVFTFQRYRVSSQKIRAISFDNLYEGIEHMIRYF